MSSSIIYPLFQLNSLTHCNELNKDGITRCKNSIRCTQPRHIGDRHTPLTLESLKAMNAQILESKAIYLANMRIDFQHTITCN